MAAETARVAALCTDASETGELDLRNCELMAVPEAIFFLLKSVCHHNVVGSSLFSSPWQSAPSLRVISLANNLLKKVSPKISIFTACIGACRSCIFVLGRRIFLLLFTPGH